MKKEEYGKNYVVFLYIFLNIKGPQIIRVKQRPLLQAHDNVGDVFSPFESYEHVAK